MQKSFPRNARQGPACPECGGETLLATQRPDSFECLSCGHVLAVPEDDMVFSYDEEDPGDEGEAAR